MRPATNERLQNKSIKKHDKRNNNLGQKTISNISEKTCSSLETRGDLSVI